MIIIAFPTPQFKLKQKGEKRFIFDTVRRRWLLLTEEEWVRQNFLAYLVTVLQYPKEAIALEKAITLNGLKKRFDILVYNSAHQPWLMVECKAPQVPLSENVLQQVLRYNLALPSSWLVLTNGSHTMAWQSSEGSLAQASHLPTWV